MKMTQLQSCILAHRQTDTKSQIDTWRNGHNFKMNVQLHIDKHNHMAKWGQFEQYQFPIGKYWKEKKHTIHEETNT